MMGQSRSGRRDSPSINCATCELKSAESRDEQPADSVRVSLNSQVTQNYGSCEVATQEKQNSKFNFYSLNGNISAPETQVSFARKLPVGAGKGSVGGNGNGDGRNASRDSEPEADEDEDEEANKKSLIQRAAKRIPGLGIIFALCASVFLGSAGMLVKLTSSVHGIQVAVCRAMIQLAIYACILRIRRLAIVPSRDELGAVFARAVLGGSSITFSYYALKLIPLGDATTIRFSLPIWALIVGYFVLNESCSLLKISAVLISILGVVLIAKPDLCIYLMHVVLHWLRVEDDTRFAVHELEYRSERLMEEIQVEPAAMGQALDPSRQLEGCLLALASSICLAMSLIALRLCKRTPAEVTICWLSIFSIAFGTITLLALGEWSLPDNLRDVALIVLNGLCGSIGQWFITTALKIEQSGVIALARTFDIEIAFLYSALLLHERIEATSIVGSLLVSSGVLAVVVPKWLESRRADQREEENSSQNNCDANETSPETTTTTASSYGFSAPPPPYGKADDKKPKQTLKCLVASQCELCKQATAKPPGDCDVDFANCNSNKAAAENKSNNEREKL